MAGLCGSVNTGSANQGRGAATFRGPGRVMMVMVNVLPPQAVGEDHFRPLLRICRRMVPRERVVGWVQAGYVAMTGLARAGRGE